MTGTTEKNGIPLVSVGLPIFNGENYLHQAIESVIQQTYPNWELIISDNGSTDMTPAICRHYQEKDSRIHYHRLEKNYGASLNFNRTFTLSNGPYFKWLAHDDVMAPENIAKAVEVLENREEIVLCGCQKKTMDAEGHIIRHYLFEELKLTSDDPAKRYKQLLKVFEHFSYGDFVFGLHRREKLKDTNLIGKYAGADVILLAQLILKGKFYVIDEPLFFRRIHPGISMSLNNKQGVIIPSKTPGKIYYKSFAEVAKWFDPKNKARQFPHFVWLKVFIQSIHQDIPGRSDRLSLYLSSYKWTIRKFYQYLKGTFRRKMVGKIKLRVKIILNQYFGYHFEYEK
jgi:glycosyltransferase involved in cell wall biosynthesis